MLLTENIKHVTFLFSRIGAGDYAVMVAWLTGCQSVLCCRSCVQWFIDAIGVITIIHRAIG